MRSALEQEETNARVADAEAKVDRRSPSGTSADRRGEAARGAQGRGLAAQSLSDEEVEALITKGAEAQARLGELEDQHAVIQDSITHLEALRASHHKEAQAAEQALLKANEATAASVADSVGRQGAGAERCCSSTATWRARSG